jgi:tetratricopeptide (TPR) repeat protein
LSRAHLANRDPNAALAVLDEVLKSEPAYVPGLALASAIALQAGKVENAAGYVERLRRIAPDVPGTLALEGDLAMAQKRHKDALAFYRKASAQGGNTQLVLAQYRAASLAGEAKPEAVLEEWVAKNPGDVAVVTVLAEGARGRGNIDGAIKLYSDALAKAPDNVVLLNNLANLYDIQGNAKALEFAERAYKAAPNAPAIIDTYGWILFRQGQVDKAIPLLQEALKGMPDNAEVQYHLAAALAKKGNSAEALSLINKAVKGQLPADKKADALALQKRLAQ